MLLLFLANPGYGFLCLFSMFLWKYVVQKKQELGRTINILNLRGSFWQVVICTRSSHWYRQPLHSTQLKPSFDQDVHSNSMHTAKWGFQKCCIHLAVIYLKKLIINLNVSCGCWTLKNVRICWCWSGKTLIFGIFWKSGSILKCLLRLILIHRHKNLSAEK